MKLPSDIYSVHSVREIDRRAINEARISGYTLMNRAAAAALDVARREYPEARRWQVICGAGNNAGDGYVLARLAAGCGIDVSVQAVVAPDKLTGDAAQAFADFSAQGGALENFADTVDPQASLLVDALLGSGLERDVAGRFAEAVAAMNEHPAPVIALDLPSGVHGDSGAVMGVAVQAAHTVTFVGLKSGPFLDAGTVRAGKLHYADLDIPASCFTTQAPELRRIDEDTVRALLPRRKRTAHKGDFGHVLIVGGGPGMSGAVRLCGEEALRAGAGLVSIATHPSHSVFVAGNRPELMCHGVAGARELSPLLERATVVALGPGLGTDPWSRTLFEKVSAAGKPLVIDADGLNLLAANPTQYDNWILTPHPGEAGRLLGTGAADVQRDRRDAVRRLHERYGGTVVLKGAGSLISADNGPPWLCSGGNPGMASAGMGDVLTGMIAALRAQGLAREMAAVAGVELHARAGDSAAGNGEIGMLASDLVAELRSCIRH
jgi:NAD(P)H-hydrate epimerase